MSTAREIVLRDADLPLLPVPALPERPEVVSPDIWRARPADYHPETDTAWVEMWQYQLVREAPSVDHHLMLVYIALLDQIFYRSDKGGSITELAKEARTYAEMWGFGEKGRRHLQITIQDAEEAMERGRKAQTVQFTTETPSAVELGPKWSEDDEDDGSIIEADVVEP